MTKKYGWYLVEADSIAFLDWKARSVSISRPAHDLLCDNRVEIAMMTMIQRWFFPRDGLYQYILSIPTV